MYAKKSTIVLSLGLVALLSGCSGGAKEPGEATKTDAGVSEEVVLDADMQEFPLDLETTVHNSDALKKLSKVSTTIYASPNQRGEVIFSPNLEIVSYSAEGPMQPMDFREGKRYSLGGEPVTGFVGYFPWNSIVSTDPDGTTRKLALSDNSEVGGHELVVDSGGNFWFTRHLLEKCEMYEKYCGGPFKPETVTQLASCVVTQVNSEGEVVYTWNAVDHLPVSELRYDKWSKVGGVFPPLNPGEDPAVAAPWHCNAADVSEDGNYFLVGMRHTDSVYKVNKLTGEVVWKIGGNEWVGKSLKIKSNEAVDSKDPISGQHDVRFINSETITLLDNGTGTDRAARGLVISVDEGRAEATVNNVMIDPSGNSSNCTGSFRPFDNMNYWIAGWGCSPNAATVFDKNGNPIVSIAPADTAKNSEVFAKVGVTPAREKLLNRQISYRFTPQN